MRWINTKEPLILLKDQIILPDFVLSSYNTSIAFVVRSFNYEINCSILYFIVKLFNWHRQFVFEQRFLIIMSTNYYHRGIFIFNSSVLKSMNFEKLSIIFSWSKEALKQLISYRYIFFGNITLTIWGFQQLIINQLLSFLYFEDFWIPLNLYCRHIRLVFGMS